MRFFESVSAGNGCWTLALRPRTIMSRTEPEALRIAPSHVGLRLRFPRSHPSVTVGGRLRRVGPTFMHRRRTAFLGPRLPAQSRSLDGFWAPLTTGTSLIVPLRAFGRNRLPSAWPWALWRGITDGWVKRTTVPFHLCFLHASGSVL